MHRKIQPENIEQVNKSFVSKEGQEYESDLIYKVGLDKKYEAYFYILMEFQSSPDRSMPLRMLNYVVQFWQSLESAKAGIHYPQYSRLCCITETKSGTQRPKYCSALKKQGYRKNIYQK